jgi:DTW domain-containing protein YfiP
MKGGEMEICDGCGNEVDLCICEEIDYYEEHGGIEAANSDTGTHGEGY